MAESPPPVPPYRLKPKAEFTRANQLGTGTLLSANHNVFAWREQARQIERDGGLDQVTPVARSNRRAFDYWTLLLLGNLFLTTIAVWGRQNLFVLVGCSAGMLLFTVTLTWTLWGMIKRY